MMCAKKESISSRLRGRNSSKQILLLMLAVLVMSACSSKPTGRYSIKQDTAPNFDYGNIDYQNVDIKHEPYNVWTSRPYRVLGKDYQPMQTGKGFTEHGQASWYGQKFHGHKTANGEIFDMFALTAAHKTLPLPSIVRVTNTKNGKSVNVRVNDRGPFHGSRILDMSYGAAKKLGFHKNGVANIRLEVIHIDELGDIMVGNDPTLYTAHNGELIAKVQPLPATPSELELMPVTASVNNSSESGLFVQVMAMENGEKAKTLGQGLSNLLQVPTSIPKAANIYKLHLGPLASEQKAQKIIQELKKIGFEQAFTIEVLP